MESLKLSMISPCVGYLDETSGANALAMRPATLEGKVLGVLGQSGKQPESEAASEGSHERPGGTEAGGLALDPMAVRIQSPGGGQKMQMGMRVEGFAPTTM